jgi:hypothetical protein
MIPGGFCQREEIPPAASGPLAPRAEISLTIRFRGFTVGLAERGVLFRFVAAFRNADISCSEEHKHER